MSAASPVGWTSDCPSESPFHPFPPALYSVRLTCKGCISEPSCFLNSSWLASEEYQWEVVGESEHPIRSLPVDWDRVRLVLPPQMPQLLLGNPLHMPLFGFWNFMNGCGFLLLPAQGLFYIILGGFPTPCPHLCK